MTDGRCAIHQANPLSCELELIKLTKIKGQHTLTKRLFGRGRGFMRVDGERGAKCKMIPFDPQKIKRDIYLIEEMIELAQRLKVETKLVNVVRFLERHLDKLKNGMIPQKNINFK